MLTFVFLNVAFAKAPRIPAIAEAKEITWLGIDLTRAEFYIPETFTEPGRSYPWVGGMSYPMYVPAQERVISSPKDALEAFASGWNELFRSEQLDDLAEFTRKPVKSAVSTLLGPTHSDGSASWFHMESGSAREAHLTPEIVAEMVKSYPSAELGMVIIADRFSKQQNLGCMWPVLYNKDHQVIWTEHMCGQTRGLGLRNYYYGPFKEVLENLEDVRKKQW